MCPICELENIHKVQTKEHIWSGECIGTRDLSDWKYEIKNQCTKQNINTNVQEEIIQTIQKEREEFDTQKYNLSNHGKATALTGLWSNRVILDIRNKLIYESWELNNAMKFTMKLMEVIQNVFEKVAKRFNDYMDIFIMESTELEHKEYENTRTRKRNNITKS